MTDGNFSLLTIAFVRCILTGDTNKIPAAVARQTRIELRLLLPGIWLLIQRVSHNIGTSLLGKNVHPVTVATFDDQLCHLEPKPTVTNLGQT